MEPYRRSGRDWNDIFLWNKVDDSNYCERNRLMYNEVKKESYETLDACVKHAIATGNHTAFVHFFMSKAKKQKDIFLKVLWGYLDEYEEKLSENEKLADWNDFFILDSLYWRSFTFDYTEKNIKKYSYKKGMLSLWKSNIDDTIPKRDVIVQCCFYFGKNVEETNQLLLAAGQEQLYILDVVDAVEMYYLDKYCGNFEISIFEKLKEVKQKINLGLEQCYKNREDIVAVRGFKCIKLIEKKLTNEEEQILQVLKPSWQEDKISFEILKQKTEIAKTRNRLKEQYEIEYYETCGRESEGDEERELYQNIYIKLQVPKVHKDYGNYLEWSSKTGNLYRYEKKPVLELGRTSAIGWDVDAEIKKYRDILEQEQQLKSAIENAEYLTLLYNDKFLEETMDIDKFIESGTIGDSKEWVFAQKRYGYYMKTLEYIKHYFYYMKNLQYSPCKVNSEGCAISIETLRQREQFLDAMSAKFVKNIKEKKKYKEEKLNQILVTILNKIWEISDAIDGKEYLGEHGRVEKRSGQFKVKNLIEGRNILIGKGYEAEEKEELKEAYKMDFTDKMQLMKFAIAAGREDEIGTYLKLAGFWKIEYEEMEELVDRIDCVILYALKYRDALLEQWAFRLGVDRLEYKNEARKEFPFIKLLMTINRDIQFVNEKILNKSNKELEKDLIYPIILEEGVI